MVKIHFSIPGELLEWLDGEAKQYGMKRSHYLAHVLLDAKRLAAEPKPRPPRHAENKASLTPSP